MHYWLYLIALISLSQASIIIRWSTTDPLVLGIWRLFFAAIILKSWTLIRKSNYTISSLRHWRNIAVTGVLFFVHLYSYAYAAHHTTIAHLMLIYSINPVFTAVGNMIFFKEKLTPRFITAFLLAFSGIYYLVASNLKEQSYNLSGDLIAILSALSFAGYALFSKNSRKTIPNMIFTSAFYAISSFCFLIASFVLSVNPYPHSSKSWIAILLLAVFPTMLGHSIFTYCMNYIDIQILSLGKLIEPILSAGSAWLLFGEPITNQHIISFILISS
jgi:drug/metabolite transporter (DMT)-like permease